MYIIKHIFDNSVGKVSLYDLEIAFDGRTNIISALDVDNYIPKLNSFQSEIEETDRDRAAVALHEEAEERVQNPYINND